MSVAFDTRRPEPVRVHFTTLPTIDGWEVVDDRGRAVDKRDTLMSATGVATHLNLVAKGGAKALAVALGAAH